jgi:hypothetical protein
MGGDIDEAAAEGEAGDDDQGREKPVDEEPVVSWWAAQARVARFPDLRC